MAKDGWALWAETMVTMALRGERTATGAEVSRATLTEIASIARAEGNDLLADNAEDALG